MPEEGLIRIRPSDARIHELRFTREEWGAFVEGVKAGEFDF